jgi:hypothetical protein
MGSERKLIFALAAGGAAFFLLSLIAFWLALLLGDEHTFIPNYEERLAMFKSVIRRPRPGSSWIPRQGDNWIF